MSKHDITCDDGNANLFYSYAEHINNPKKLTTEQMRRFTGFEDISEDAAQEIIDGLYKLTIITYKMFQNGNRTV